MSNELSVMEHKDLMDSLQNSLYPGAKTESCNLVLSYCRASNLDPMLKPVHIVPIWSSSAGGMKDVVMPGIGLYRIIASRTGQLLGISDAVYGPIITERLGGVDVSYPEYASVTVKRAVGQHVAEFTATEYWIENYAVKGGKEKSVAPNAMWLRRVRAQLAKCAEAQALRKGFPEVGSAPTAEEMEGKNEIDITPDKEPQVAIKQELKPYPQAKFDENYATWEEMVLSGKKNPQQIIAMVSTKAILSDEQKKMIKDIGKVIEAEQPKGVVTTEDLNKIEEFTYAQVMDSINNATKMSELDDARDMIGQVKDDGHRKELLDLFRKREATMAPF